MKTGSGLNPPAVSRAPVFDCKRCEVEYVRKTESEIRHRIKFNVHSARAEPYS